MPNLPYSGGGQSLSGGMTAVPVREHIRMRLWQESGWDIVGLVSGTTFRWLRFRQMLRLVSHDVRTRFCGSVNDGSLSWVPIGRNPDTVVLR